MKKLEICLTRRNDQNSSREFRSIRINDNSSLNRAIISSPESVEGVFVYLDHSRPNSGQIESLLKRLKLDQVIQQSTVQGYVEVRGSISPSAVAPVSNGCSGVQAIEPSDQTKGRTAQVEYLDPFFILYDAKKLKEIHELDGFVFDPDMNFKDATEDLLLRLERLGGVFVVALDVQIQKSDSSEASGGCSFKLLNKWKQKTENENTVAGLCSVNLEAPEDLLFLRRSIIRNSEVFDKMAFIVSKLPEQPKNRSIFLGADLCFFDDLLNASEPKEKIQAFQKWVRSLVSHEYPFVADLWAGFRGDLISMNTALNKMAFKNLGCSWHFRIEQDEIIENKVTNESLKRVLSHPDPFIKAFDVGILVHWFNESNVRKDPPYGSKDHSVSSSSFRIWRTSKAKPRICNPSGVPNIGILGRQPTGIRLRCLSLMTKEQREKLAKTSHSKDQKRSLMGAGSVHVSPYRKTTKIAFCMMFHEKEKINDLQRHLNTFYPFTEKMIIVWTSKAAPSSEVIDLVNLYGAELINYEFTDSLSDCRNSALEFLLNENDQVNWVLYLDPDEMISNPINDLNSIRSMAETDLEGFKFKFANIMPDGDPTFSETVRMFKLSSKFKYQNRVHETLDHSFKEVSESDPVFIGKAPFTVIHLGMNKGDQRLQEKLNKYTELLIKELEENPDNASAWVSLSLQFSNDGHDQEAEKCLLRSLECSEKTYLTHKEFALRHLRKSKFHLEKVASMLPENHPIHVESKKLLEPLEKIEQPKLGNARSGQANTENLRLPCTL